jgi:hypothetical protein
VVALVDLVIMVLEMVPEVREVLVVEEQQILQILLVEVQRNHLKIQENQEQTMEILVEHIVELLVDMHQMVAAAPAVLV